jgi:hypothetical protein
VHPRGFFVIPTSYIYLANRHVRDKTGEQLQKLRDLGLPTILGGGRYRLR